MGANMGRPFQLRVEKQKRRPCIIGGEMKTPYRASVNR